MPTETMQFPDPSSIFLHEESSQSASHGAPSLSGVQSTIYSGTSLSMPDFQLFAALHSLVCSLQKPPGC